MSKGKIKIVLFLIVFLLILAVVCNVLIDISESRNKTGEDLHPSYVNNNSPAAPDANNPGSSGTVVIPTPPRTNTPGSSGTVTIPTAPPTPIPTIEPTPTPTPVPTIEVIPIPADTVIGTGSFTSDTGLPINITATWTAEVIDSSSVRVTVDVDLTSYSLFINEMPTGVYVNVGDQYKSAGTPSVQHEENTQIVTRLASTQHTLKLSDGNSATYPIAVEYHFGGTYKKTDLPVIECGGEITLVR